MSQSYINQIRNLRRNQKAEERAAFRQAIEYNGSLAAAVKPDQDKYDAWFKQVYGVEPNSDEAISATPSNKYLDDTRPILDADEFDSKFQQEETSHWANELSSSTLRKRGFD